MASTYFELLKHPLWQKKRLEILSRHNFTCEDCGADDKTLHVHHTYYEKGLKPWEYPDHSLHALCVDCHAKAQDLMTLLNRTMGELDGGDPMQVYGYAKGLALVRTEMVIEVLSYEMAVGVGAAYGHTAEEIINALSEQSIDSAELFRLSHARRQPK